MDEQMNTQGSSNNGTNGLAIAALITGILCLGIIPLLLGIFGLKKANKMGGKGKGMAIAGIVLGIIALLLTPIFFSGFLAFFGVLSPSKMMPERTTFRAPQPNTDIAMITEDGTVEIAFRNNAGGPITITGIATGTQDCDTIRSVQASVQGTVIDSSTEIANGDAYILTFDCGNFKKGERVQMDLSFDYVQTDGQLAKTAQGSVYGTVR